MTEPNAKHVRRAIIEHTGRLPESAAVARPDTAVPTTPEWTLTDLVEHVGQTQYWVAKMKGPPMNPDEVRAELELPESQELLRYPGPVRLAYNGLDGLPRVVPIGFYWTGEHVVMCSATTSPKARAIARRPDVALTIDIGSTPADAKTLNLRGRAVVEIVDGVPDEFLRSAAKGLDQSGMAEFEPAVRATYEQMARIAVRPSWARFFDFGAGRLPSFLTELMERARG